MGQGASSPRDKSKEGGGTSYPRQTSATPAYPTQPPPYGQQAPNPQCQPGTSAQFGGQAPGFDNAFDRLDRDITDSMGDHARFYNTVRDTSVPVPPGHASTTQIVYVPQPVVYGQPPPNAPSPFVPTHQENPPAYNTMYPDIEKKEQKLNEMETGMK